MNSKKIILFVMVAITMLLAACSSAAAPADSTDSATTEETDVQAEPVEIEESTTDADAAADLEEPAPEAAPTEMGAADNAVEASQLGSRVVLPPDLVDLVEVQLDFGNDHVSVGEPVDYPVYPPTSGTHWGQWAQPGVYQEPVPAEAFVHSMEHGYVVLLYNCGDDCALTGDEFVAFARSLPPSEKYGYPKIVISADEKIDTPYALLAWQHYMPLDAWDEAAVLNFYNATMDKGPEDAG